MKIREIFSWVPLKDIKPYEGTISEPPIPQQVKHNTLALRQANQQLVANLHEDNHIVNDTILNLATKLYCCPIYRSYGSMTEEYRRQFERFIDKALDYFVANHAAYISTVIRVFFHCNDFHPQYSPSTNYWQTIHSAVFHLHHNRFDLKSYFLDGPKNIVLTSLLLNLDIFRMPEYTQWIQKLTDGYILSVIRHVNVGPRKYLFDCELIILARIALYQLLVNENTNDSSFKKPLSLVNWMIKKTSRKDKQESNQIRLLYYILLTNFKALGKEKRIKGGKLSQLPYKFEYYYGMGNYCKILNKTINTMQKQPKYNVKDNNLRVQRVRKQLLAITKKLFATQAAQQIAIRSLACVQVRTFWLQYIKYIPCSNHLHQQSQFIDDGKIGNIQYPKKPIKLVTCCGMVLYCSTVCRAQHWQLGHKHVCLKRSKKPKNCT